MTDGTDRGPHHGPAPRARKTSESVARRIVRDVAGMPPGAALAPEAQMLQQYGVSRASLREALRLLEVHGLITIKSGPGGGPRVAAVDAADFGRTVTFFYRVTGATVRELAEARLLVEPAVARQAAVLRPADGLARLHESVRAARALSGADARAYLDLSLRFHGLVARMSGNRVLALLGSSFEEIFAVYASDPPPAAEQRPVVEAHAQIAEAIADGDADLAEKRMRDHLLAVHRHLAKRYPHLDDSVVDWV